VTSIKWLTGARLIEVIGLQACELHCFLHRSENRIASPGNRSISEQILKRAALSEAARGEADNSSW